MARKIPGGVSSVLRDFLRKCFHKQPEFRKGADELLDHPWLRVKRENVEVEATFRRHGMSNSDESSALQMQELKTIDTSDTSSQRHIYQAKKSWQ